MFSEFQSVVLVRDIGAEEQAGFEDQDFKRGDVGVLVDFLGGKGCVAIEFNMGKAHTADVLFISETDIRSIDPAEIWHVRPLNPRDRDTTPAEWEQGKYDGLEHDSLVVLTRSFADAGLEKGDLGLIITCNPETSKYQFQAAVGEDWTGPLVTVGPDDVRPWERDEIPVVREFKLSLSSIDRGHVEGPCT